MTFDFSQLQLPQNPKAPTDPFKIFAALPRLSGAPNDLWRGQAEALGAWDEKRASRDVLLSLNTGAGKTLVGLLIAKSFCNEGLDNVLYVCPTIDLVNQTAAQARSVGIQVTTRTDSNYDNDLFEAGQTFCITSYHAIFNGLSSIRRKHFPSAIIFDDAHVAESMMRDAFTLSLDPDHHASLILGIFNTFLPTFSELNREGEFRDAFQANQGLAYSALVPPDAVASFSAQLETMLRDAGVGSDPKLKYAYQHLRDHLGVCAVVVRGGKVEITPPFLPSLALDVFASNVRRVYLSATLGNKADIVRAFGRLPDVVIEPNNDAGNGERLIQFERNLVASKIDSSFAARLNQKHKVLIAVPNYRNANLWSSVASPPNRDEFSTALETFRSAPSGSFVLVNRVDGIDLPHDTCRLMIMEGIPRSEGLLERYQFEYLNMRTFAASRIANRLVQLFGRINRGRSDYGAFLISGRELNIWLANHKHIALLPDLLKKQILLGQQVQEGMNIVSLDALSGLLDTVLLSSPRDQGWLNYYSQFIDGLDVSEEKTRRAQLAEERNLAAAQAEARYAKSVWERNFQDARIALDEIVADTARADEKLAGWHNLWIGAALYQEGDVEQAYFYYGRARGQLGLNLTVPTQPVAIGQTSPTPLRSIVGKLMIMMSLGRESFNKQSSRLGRDLSALDGGTPAQMEEAVRNLGENLGFSSTRPDNDFGTGPDVLWYDTEQNLKIGIELKTDKNIGSRYSKDDISQSHDHLVWLNDNAEGADIGGNVLVGPASGFMDQANPPQNLFQIDTQFFAQLRNRLQSIIADAYNRTPMERLEYLERATADLDLRSLAVTLLASAVRQ